MMTMTSEAKYAGYIYRKPEVDWTSTTEVKKTLTRVDYSASTHPPKGGMPIISDGKVAYEDTSDNHCIIFGASGFKKSLCAFLPLIHSLTLAGESMVLLDPKGELYTKSAALMKAAGYRVIVLNFRDFNGDAYNPLHYPARLWKEGERDKATLIANQFAAALAARQEASRTIDPFWPDTAKAYMSGVLPWMFEGYAMEQINLLNLADYFTDETAELLKRLLNGYSTVNTAIANMRTVLAEPDKTRMSTLSTASSFIQPFLQNEKLAKMLSYNTFELEDIADEKIALFIITDDTTPMCNPIVSALVSQLQSVLVDKAFHSGGKLPIRVNFVLDEFASFPFVNMTEALATHRSRNIRYYLCVQSLDALSEKYPHYESLIVNCATTLFLGSTEPQLLSLVSERLGTTDKTASGKTEPLISVPQLQTLKKAWDYKEAIYFNLADAVRYCTVMPAYEQYALFAQYGESTLPNKQYAPIAVLKYRDFVSNNSGGKLPFAA